MSLKEQAVGGVKWNGVGTATVALLQLLKLWSTFLNLVKAQMLILRRSLP